MDLPASLNQKLSRHRDQTNELIRLADRFMSEYGITFRQFCHDFTPSQINYLQRKIEERKAVELQHLASLFHAKDPQKFIDNLTPLAATYATPKRQTGITEELKRNLNITVIPKEDT